MTTREEATAEGDRTIVMSREYDATPYELYRAWVNPQAWAQWFAPEPMSVPKVQTDPRPGGHYVFVMRDPEGNDFTSTGTYEEVVEAEKIVYRDSVEEMPQSFIDMVNQARGAEPGTPVADGVATVTFEPADGKTKMTFREEFDSKATRDAWVEMQMIEGLDAGFDNLEKLLAEDWSDESC